MKKLSYKSKQSIHMAALSGIFWFAWAMSNYWSVYLKEQGFDASMVGVLNSFCSATSLASVPLWGIVADKTRSVKKVETILLIFMSIFWGIVPLYPKIFNGSLLPFFFAIPLACFFKNPASTFHENLLVRNCNELKIEYGKLRWVGSLIFTAGSAVIFWTAGRFGYASTWWMFGICMIPVIILTMLSRDPQGEDGENTSKRSKKEKLNLAELFKSRSYIIFLIFALIYYLALNFESIFIPFFMEDIGVDSGNYALFVGYRALLEIPLLLLMGRLKKRFSLKRLLQIVPALQLIECILFCFFVRSWTGMLLATTFMGLGNGLFIGTVYNYCYEIAPENVKASAQAFYATISSIGSITGSLVGGFVMDAVGGRYFFLVTGSMFLLSAVFLFAADLIKKKPAVQ